MGKNAKEHSVLAVDDDPNILKLYQRRLRRYGYDVRTVLNAEEAEIAIGERLPDMILLDVFLPHTSGLEYLTQLRQNPRTKTLPIILVSGSDDTEHVVRGLDEGANDYVVKPFQMEVLLARMQTQLRLASLVKKLESQTEALSKLAAYDELTGVYNRRSLFKALESEISRSARYSYPLSVMMLDLDHFKKINDDHGHAAGDAVLRRFALVVGETLRKIDVLCRYGGEEFCAILPETSISAAIKVAERVREAIERDSITFEDVELSITVSIGITAVTPLRGAEPDHLLSEADKALYDAKTSGRNRVEVFSREESHG